MEDPLSNLKNLTDFTSLAIKLASPEAIRVWSRGEITKPETINYRTLKPEKDGLFDERIFGPTKDWECYCGKYKRIRYKGIVCDKCGVEVTQSRVRRERMGHISLAAPVVHVWFFKGAPSRISLLLDLPSKALEQVIYFVRYLVLDVDDKGRKNALTILIQDKKSQLDAIRQEFKDRKENVQTEAKEDKTKVTNRIKDKEQLALAQSEIDLNTRKKITLISEEEKAAIARNDELFDRLEDIAKKVKPLSLLTEDEYDELSVRGAAEFIDAQMGANALLDAIAKVDLDKISKELKEELTTIKKTESSRFIKIAKRLKMIDGIRKSGVNPSWMILRTLPVLPPDLRPMVQLSGGRFATSDLNDLYRRVINRNNRLKHLIELSAPEIILRNEKRMLQESVDSLIDASQRQATRRGRGRQVLRSLSDMLRGKQGRFRQNLLGKRVDYSGRSVIVVGPDLNLNQCGLPKEMALEMFKPFVLREMIIRGVAPNVKSAKNMIEHRPDEVFDILEEITKNHPVLLNRAPTLHKLGIQAFYPILIEGSAIRVHPAVCSGYNADFDGDQMAVHVPLSKRSKDEAESLMLPGHNLLRPSDGSPITTPSSKEMALGVFYLTSHDPRLQPRKTPFSDADEVIHALLRGTIELRQYIQVRIKGKIIETTPGRIMFNEALPENFDFINEAVNSKIIKKLFSEAFTQVSTPVIVKMVDDIKNLGFKAGTISGLSFGITDAQIHPGKQSILDQASKKVAANEENFKMGLITADEKRRLTIQDWIDATDEIADITWENLDETNPIRLVIEAGVGRASRDQVKQLAGARGLVNDPLGRIVEMPIRSNFREGLSVFEYVTSSRGSRKGLTDTALKTADAGYLTRRLVDVTHDILVREEDCGTKEGITISSKVRPEAFQMRIIGRTLASNIKDNKGKLIASKGQLIEKEIAEKIISSKVEEVVVRSPLTCELRYGICQKCYGLDLTSTKMVELGTPAGVIAAQSIGEPGTQLTLRTKHSGGVVGVDVTQGLPRVEELFESRVPKSLSPLSEIAGKVIVGESEEGWKVTVNSTNTKPKEQREYIIPKTQELKVEDGQLIDAGTQIAEGSANLTEILTINGLRPAQEYLVNELQAVYESQGIPINDKHFEIIVRKMSDKVRIVSAGDTNILIQEMVDKARFEEENEKVLAAGGEPAVGQQIILGITRASLKTDSWLSAASFQQTTEILTDAALQAREDKLVGLKENVIIGRLIPVTPERASLSQIQGV